MYPVTFLLMQVALSVCSALVFQWCFFCGKYCSVFFLENPFCAVTLRPADKVTKVYRKLLLYLAGMMSYGATWVCSSITQQKYISGHKVDFSVSV